MDGEMSFDTLSSKQAFCDLLGYLPENSMLIRGEGVLKLIEGYLEMLLKAGNSI